MAMTSLPVTNVPKTALSLVPLVPFLRNDDSHLESIIVRETGIQGARQMAGDMSHQWDGRSLLPLSRSGGGVVLSGLQTQGEQVPQDGSSTCLGQLPAPLLQTGPLMKMSEKRGQSR